MAKSSVPTGAFILVLALAAGLLPPESLAAQQPTSVAFPSPEVARPDAASSPASLPFSRVARPTARGTRGVVPGIPDPLSPTVLDAVLAFAAPASAAGEALSAPPGATSEDPRESLGSLADVIPRALSRDLLALKARILEARAVLFGRKGIVGFGQVEGSDRQSRIRLNLQAGPDPGVRVTLLTP